MAVAVYHLAPVFSQHYSQYSYNARSVRGRAQQKQASNIYLVVILGTFVAGLPTVLPTYKTFGLHFKPTSRSDDP